MQNWSEWIKRHPKWTLTAGIVAVLVGGGVAGTEAEAVGAVIGLAGIIAIVVAVRVMRKAKKLRGISPNNITATVSVPVETQRWQIESALKQLTESMELVKTSKNLDTVESRIKYGLQRAHDLKGMESAGVYCGAPSSQDFIGFFEHEAQEYIRKLKEPEAYDTMSGIDFEHFCAGLLKSNGFTDVEVTTGAGDHGVDVFATKDGVTYAIQCKRLSSNVGNKAVQEIFSGKEFYKKHIGVVMTNQHFTPAAKEAAERTGIILWDRDRLEEFIAAASPETDRNAQSARQLEEAGATHYVVSTTGDERVCEKCAAHEGKKYRVEDAVTGVNHPPFCEKCRCVTLPVFDIPGVELPWDKK